MAELTDHKPPADDVPAMMRELLETVRRIEAALAAQPRRVPKSPGRNPIDDADALQEVRDLMANGLDQWAAISSVAVTLGGNAKAHAQRLRRKLRGS